MARQSSGNWRVTCGRTKRFAVQAQIGESWVTAATADTEAALAAAVARTRSRRPERALRVVEFGRDGSRSTREPAAAAA